MKDQERLLSCLRRNLTELAIHTPIVFDDQGGLVQANRIMKTGNNDIEYITDTALGECYC